MEEGIRGFVNEIPFRSALGILVKRLVESTTRSLKLFPADDGVSDTLNLFHIVTGVPFVGMKSGPMDFRSDA